MKHTDRQRWREPDYLAPVIFVVAVLIAAVLFWPYGKKPTEPVTEEPPAVLQDDLKLQGKTGGPQIQYPGPQETEKPGSAITQPQQEFQPLPVLDKGKVSIEEEFRQLYDEQKFGGLFLLKNFIPNFVVTIDNMTGAKLSQKYRFTKPPVGQFQAIKDVTGNEFIDPRNYGRYIPYIDLAEAVDIGRFVSFYVRYYALFQQAYHDLGYLDRYFNDRFVQVLDHLLTAPEVRVPIQLVRPRVYYQFADPELDALSAGQKILVRIGPDNAARVKARIRELRQALTSLQSKK